jgi:cation:H+ antiporter
MSFTLVLFLVGFYILIKGANFLVDGATAIARRFNISLLVIGLVIAGIGTSIPEFAISFIGNLTGEEQLGLGTIVGSNTMNILFILGITALVFPLRLREEWVNRDLVWNVFAVFTAMAFALPLGDGVITRIEGIAMLAIFFLWLYMAITKSNNVVDEEHMPFRAFTAPLAFTLIGAGLVGVILGGRWVVAGAAEVALFFGMSEALIGLTIVGIGTSLPELAVSFVAAYRGEPGIAVGNVVGSNIFDFLLILGFGALVQPIVYPQILTIDIVVTLFAAMLLYGFMYVGEFYVLKRWQGLVLAFLYIVYLIYIFGRG